MYRKKLKEVWMKEGDRNIDFFHAKVIQLQRQNKIEVIWDWQNWWRSK